MFNLMIIQQSLQVGSCLFDITANVEFGVGNSYDFLNLDQWFTYVSFNFELYYIKCNELSITGTC
jgi:hypothetical protein